MRIPTLTIGGLLLAVPCMASSLGTAWIHYSQAILSGTFILVIVLVGGMALRYGFRNHYRGPLGFWAYAVQNPLVRLAAFVVLVAALVNLLLPQKKLESPHQVAEFASYRHMPNMAEQAYGELSQQYPFILRYHFEFVAAHYGQESWADKDGEVDIVTESENPTYRYAQLSFERNPYIKDIARLGLGMCNYYEYSFDLAMDQFRQIQTKYMPFKNLFMGRIQAAHGKLDSAAYYFKRELYLEEARSEATVALSAMLYAQEPDSIGQMEALIQDPLTTTHVPLELKRYVYTKEANLGSYMVTILQSWWNNLQWIGLLGALLGTVVWMMFLRRIDTLRREPWQAAVAVFTGGAIFAFLALILYDFVRWDLGFTMSADGNVGQDLLYCVFGIGVIEELVKIVPFLLLMQFTRRVDSPVSYIVYASCSALGFAFVENVMYFDAGHIGIIHGRVLICNVFHMFATSTIAFGMMLGRFRFGNLQWPFFFLFFLLAAFMHGFYDFWIINETVSLLVLMSYVFFIYATFQYAGYLNNALNQSGTLRGNKPLDAGKLAVFLTVGLICILLFEYTGLSLAYGRGIGNHSLIKSLGMGSFLMFFVVLNLSNIDVVQGEWLWLRFWNFGTRVAYNRAIGQRLRLLPRLKDGVLAKLLPATGEVIARISLNGDSRYFLFQFDVAPVLNGHPMEYVLLRAKNDGEVPEEKQGIEAVVMAFRDKQALMRHKKRGQDFKILDVVEIE